MLFHEIFGLYYKAVAKIIEAALDGKLTDAQMRRIASETAFSESAVSIEAALKSRQWPLVRPDGSTPIQSAPKRPLTVLERRWLKAIALDPRVRLFGELEWEDDVEPLFRPGDIAVYDRYADGDPYDLPEYIGHFGKILTALREKRSLEIEYFTSRGEMRVFYCNPYRLEYSEKDDKFRLVTHGRGGGNRLNLARMKSVHLRNVNQAELIPPVRRRCEYVIELVDERNALERAMLHFADLEKQTERIEGKRYRMTIWYDVEDETELVIRVLSFGPMLRAVAPERFVNQIRNRLERQMAFGRK